MMTIYVPADQAALDKLIKSGIPLLDFKGIHPNNIPDIVKNFMKKNRWKYATFYCYNSNVLDYIDPEYLEIYFADESTKSFEKAFKSELEFEYPGEIMLTDFKDIIVKI